MIWFVTVNGHRSGQAYTDYGDAWAAMEAQQAADKSGAFIDIETVSD